MRGHLTRGEPWRYLIALGSNRRHPRHGHPRDVLAAGLAALEADEMQVIEVAPVLLTDPVGPSQRQYANSAAIVASELEPPALLARLKRTEHAFGRRARGQRWGARVLDLDIVLWSGGTFASSDLTIPHLLFRERAFVLAPAACIAPDWRDPVTGLTVRQLHARLTRPRAVRRAVARGGP